MTYRVAHIGSVFKPTSSSWGGSVATSDYLKKSFLDDKDFEIDFIDRSYRDSPARLKALLNNNNYDLVHCDDASYAELCFKNNIGIDVIGPITRAPKTMKNYTSSFQPSYTEDWFYSKVVIRLNLNEEMSLAKFPERHPNASLEDIIFVTHGVPTDILKPNPDVKKDTILWAGNKNRDAKNFSLFEAIKAKLDVEKNGFKVEVLSGYTIEQYYKKLDSTAILVNTSKYESFCNALFEAKAKGVVTLSREDLQQGRANKDLVTFWGDLEIQVPYDADSYVDKIHYLCSNPEVLARESYNSRLYAEEKASLKLMRNSWKKAYYRALDRKNGEKNVY